MWLICAFVIGVILHGAFADKVNSETFNEISALQGSMPDDIAPELVIITPMIPRPKQMKDIPTKPIAKEELYIITPSITKREVIATRPPMIPRPKQMKDIPTKPIAKEELVIHPQYIIKRELGTTTKAMYIRPNALQMKLEATPPYIIMRELETTTPVMYIRPNPLKDVFLTTTPYLIDPKTDMSPRVVVERVPVSPPQPLLNTTSSPLAVTTNQEFTTDLTDKPKKSRKYPKYRFNGKRRRKTTKQPSYTSTTMRSTSTYLPESYIVKPPICVIKPISDMPLTGGHFHNYHIKS